MPAAPSAPAQSPRRAWSTVWYHATAVVALVLALFYYWFGVADRYQVFLYFHDMGSAAFDTSPFGFITASRYWMAGLTAGGAVVVLYAGASWLLGRRPDYEPPAWWRVWLLAALPILLGVPAITMTVNDPTLPLSHAVRVTAVTLIALGPALAPGRLAARRPRALILLAADGWGLALLLVSLIGFASSDNYFSRDPLVQLATWLLVAAAAVAISRLRLRLAARRQLGAAGSG